MKPDHQHLYIVFFDGHCVLCNGTVMTLIKIDRNRKLRYSSLQGESAKQVLTPAQLASLSSLVFWSEEKFYERAEAIAHILITVGGIFKILGWVLRLIPLFISNAVYDWIARHRYRFFGRNEACMIPSPEIRDLFIP